MKNNKNYIALIALMFSFSYTYAQNDIPTSVNFANESIKNALKVSNVFEELSFDESYHLQNGGTGALAAFISDVVIVSLQERGFTIADDVELSDGAVNVRVIDPTLKLTIEKNSRAIKGEFILLFYSESGGDIKWGKEYTLTFGREDSVEGKSANYLNSAAPLFLRSGKRVVYSGNKLEKILAVTVAGIITYLFYSVRS